MNKPRAVLSGIDTRPGESMALMLRSVGYDVVMLSDKAMDKLEAKGYKGGVRHALLDDMGYERTSIPLIDDFDGNCDMFVDLKLGEAETLKRIFPNLPLVLYPINGGWDGYEDYGHHYPTITNNFWVQGKVHHVWSPMDWKLEPKTEPGTEAPIGLLHNARNWGFGNIIDEVIAKTGLRVFGAYGSPKGMIKNKDVPRFLREASAFVHLKASDCPGWAVYEAFATGTPLVVTELFISRMKFQELFKNNETCLTWGQGSFELDNKDPKKIKEFMDASAPKMVEQIVEAVERLKDPKLNREIGMAGHEQWKKLVTWTPERSAALAKFLQDNGFPANI